MCTTELGSVAKLQSEFAARGAKTIALSVDSLESHTSTRRRLVSTTRSVVLAVPANAENASLFARNPRIADWIKDIDETQACTVDFPIIADEDKKVSTLYGMLHPNAEDTMAGKLYDARATVPFPSRPYPCPNTRSTPVYSSGRSAPSSGSRPRRRSRRC